jgi:hypothetical protein
VLHQHLHLANPAGIDLTCLTPNPPLRPDLNRHHPAACPIHTHPLVLMRRQARSYQTPLLLLCLQNPHLRCLSPTLLSSQNRTRQQQQQLLLPCPPSLILPLPLPLLLLLMLT